MKLEDAGSFASGNGPNDSFFSLVAWMIDGLVNDVSDELEIFCNFQELVVAYNR